MKRVRIAAFGAAALVVLSMAAAVSAPAQATSAGVRQVAAAGTLDDVTGAYYDAGPNRLLDTRRDGTKRPLAAGSTMSLQIAGRPGVPDMGASAVVLNVTAVSTTAPGYFTVYPSDAIRPKASSLNFPAHWTGANMVTVPVGADGKVKIYNSGGATHAVVDVLGWYAQNNDVRFVSGTGSLFQPATATGDPVRRFDSRTNGDGPYFGGESVILTDQWVDDATASSIQSYVVTITAVGATKPGVLTAWAGGSVAKPATSTLNYEPGVIAPNMAIVPADHPGTALTGIQVRNTSGGSAHFIVDLVGYYVWDSVGLRFNPVTPMRFVDTRTGIGLAGPFGARQTRTVNAPMAYSGTYYVLANSTGVAPSASTYLTVWSGDGSKPVASNLNVAPGVVRSVSTYAPLSANTPTISVYNNAGSMHLVMDAEGTFYTLQPPAGGPALKGNAAAPDRTAPMPVHQRPQASTAKQS